MRNIRRLTKPGLALSLAVTTLAACSSAVPISAPMPHAESVAQSKPAQSMPAPRATSLPATLANIRRDAPPIYRVTSGETQTIVSGTGTDAAWGGVTVTGNAGWNLNLIPGAAWIWSHTGPCNGETFTASRTLTIPAGATNIQGFIDTGFDDFGRVEVNGVNFGDGGRWYSAGRANISSVLRPGANTIRLTSTNNPCSGCAYESNPAGIIGKVTLTYVPGAELTLSADALFSPNADQTKDTNTIEVKATGDWTLEVEGYGVISTGNGDRTGASAILWDGAVGGTVLPDGIYTLSVTDAAGVKKTVDVTIDTTPPKISDAIVAEVKGEQFQADEEDGYDYFYTTKIKAEDEVVNGASSEIDASSLKVKYTNAPIVDHDEGTSAGDGAFAVRSKLDRSQYDPSDTDNAIHSLAFTAQIRDAAGNKAEFSNTFAVSLSSNSFSDTTGPLGFSLASVSSDRHLLARETKTREDVYYPKADEPIKFQCDYIVGGDELKIGEIPIFITRLQEKKQNKDVYEEKGGFITNIPSHHELEWNGKEKKTRFTYDYAFPGVYKAHIGELPGYEVRHAEDIIFKVSDKPVIKVWEWQDIAPRLSDDNLKAWAHILDRHMLLPLSTVYKKIRYDASLDLSIEKKPVVEEIFGKYDTNMLMGRPTQGNGLPVGYPEVEFNEVAEAATGFVLTRSLIQDEAFQDAVRMGRAVVTYTDRRTNFGNGFEAAVLLKPKNRVLYVGVYVNNVGGADLATVFPSFKSQQDHEKAIRIK